MFAHNTGRLLWGQGSLAKKHISSFLRPPSFSVLPGAYFDSCIQLYFRVLPVCSHLLLTNYTSILSILKFSYRDMWVDVVEACLGWVLSQVLGKGTWELSENDIA
ncbi:hypothetical protein ACKLNR_012689 [Fusarium oxysporum f. sp. zingiberi]